MLCDVDSISFRIDGSVWLGYRPLEVFMYIIISLKLSASRHYTVLSMPLFFCRTWMSARWIARKWKSTWRIYIHCCRDASPWWCAYKYSLHRYRYIYMFELMHSVQCDHWTNIMMSTTENRAFWLCYVWVHIGRLVYLNVCLSATSFSANWRGNMQHADCCLSGGYREFM